MIGMAWSICCWVVSLERENRMEPCACSGSIPIARSTGEGSKEPDEHAAPADA